jgi:hypothetical protein
MSNTGARRKAALDDVDPQRRDRRCFDGRSQDLDFALQCMAVAARQQRAIVLDRQIQGRTKAELTKEAGGAPAELKAGLRRFAESKGDEARAFE